MTFKTETDGRNKYLDQGLDLEACYRLAGDWRDELPEPRLIRLQSGLTIWDDSAHGFGTKARWGQLLVQSRPEKELVYVQPRVGWAGISLAFLAARYGKKLTLFMPAAKQASPHQLVCIERGATPMFRRIAAMPVLNQIAKRYADERGAFFIPFGLDHPLVVAAGVVSTQRLAGPRGLAPNEVWSVISTGVLTRTLQIAWPDAIFHGVAVARNLHDGEVGRAQAISYDRPFQAPARLEAAENQRQFGFDSAQNYDLKGWETVLEQEAVAPKTLFWNVAGNVEPVLIKPGDVDSQREWGEIR
jgi:hypothetical protein